MAAQQAGQIDVALNVWTQALTEAERDPAGPLNHKVCLSLENIADLCCMQNNFMYAELMYWKSLAIKLICLGNKHPVVALAINKLAGVSFQQNRMSDSERLLRMSLIILENTQGIVHPDSQVVAKNLVIVLQRLGKQDESNELWERMNPSPAKVCQNCRAPFEGEGQICQNCNRQMQSLSAGHTVSAPPPPPAPQVQAAAGAGPTVQTCQMCYKPFEGYGNICVPCASPKPRKRPLENVCENCGHRLEGPECMRCTGTVTALDLDSNLDALKPSRRTTS